MYKRVFIIHGWDGYPENWWFPWLKKELENLGFLVIVPQLPQSEEPRINNWVSALKEIVGVPDENTYFIGHSMGCQAIARYLETFDVNVKVGGVVFVAGFFKELINLEDDDVVRDVAAEWLKTPLDLKKVKTHFDKSVAIFSDDDRYISQKNQEDFKNIFGSKIVIEKGKDHFDNDDVLELQVVLRAILEISNS